MVGGGSNNQIIITQWIRHTKITIHGNNNKIVINGIVNNCGFAIEGDNCQISIGEGCILMESIFGAHDNGSIISIGKNVGMQRNSRIVSMEGKTIQIGDDCMFSYDLEIRNSDGHSIFKQDDSGQIYRSNNAQDIIIGDKIWIAQQVLILKDVVVGDGSVIGVKSLLHKVRCENNSLIVGNPAKRVGAVSSWSDKRL